MREIDLIISEEEIEEYLFEELTNEGFVPTEEELMVLAAIVFDFIVMKTNAEMMGDDE